MVDSCRAAKLDLGYLNQFSGFDVDFLRYMVFVPDAGPTWQVSDLKFERDHKRFPMMESIYAGTNPIFGNLRTRVEKLILYHGWGRYQHSAIDVGGLLRDREKTMGGPAATREFFSLIHDSRHGSLQRGRRHR